MASCEHAAAAGGPTAPTQFEENSLSEVKHVIAVLSGEGRRGQVVRNRGARHRTEPPRHTVGILDADITCPSIPKMMGMSGKRASSLGKLLLPEISATGIKVMSSNLLLERETDPVLWRGPVMRVPSASSGAIPPGARSTTSLLTCPRARAMLRSPCSNRFRSTASS